MARRHEITIASELAGERLDRALARALQPAAPALSRTRIKDLILAGAVALRDGGADRAVADPSLRVRAGQNFAIDVPESEPAAAPAQALALAILHEDEDLIVLDKPPGLVVHPAPGNPDGTLVNALVAHCGPSLAGIGGVRRPGIVHRLDKDTSGLMVVAKTDAAHQALVRQFAAREVERAYTALAWGVPSPRQGEIAGAIGRSRADRKKMAVVAGGRPALTRYQVVRVLAGGAASLIECRLATGRTHQIRVHLAAIGHPVVGDPVYGRARGHRRTAPAALAGFGRQALDARVLGFTHPRTGQRLRFEKKLNSDINLLLSSLEPI